MQINVGELNKKIEFVTKQSGVDEDGFPIENEVLHHKCWAKVTNTSGTELIKANTEFTEVKTRFLVRFTNKINTNMFIKFQGQYYNIVYLNNYNHNDKFIEVYGELRELI